MYPRCAHLLLLVACLIGTAAARAQELPQPTPVQGTPLELVEFRELPLNEAMRLLSQQSGLKIVVSAEASKTNVSLHAPAEPPPPAVAAPGSGCCLVRRTDADPCIVRLDTTTENRRLATASPEA